MQPYLLFLKSEGEKSSLFSYIHKKGIPHHFKFITLTKPFFHPALYHDLSQKIHIKDGPSPLEAANIVYKGRFRDWRLLNSIYHRYLQKSIEMAKIFSLNRLVQLIHFDHFKLYEYHFPKNTFSPKQTKPYRLSQKIFFSISFTQLIIMLLVVHPMVFLSVKRYTPWITHSNIRIQEIGAVCV